MVKEEKKFGGGETLMEGGRNLNKKKKKLRCEEDHFCREGAEACGDCMS